MKIGMMIGVVCVAMLACGGGERLREAERQLSIAEERLAAYEDAAATATAMPTPTATAMPTPTATAMPTPTATAMPTPTATAIPTPTATDRYECNMKIAAAMLVFDLLERDTHLYQGWIRKDEFPEEFNTALRVNLAVDDPVLSEWVDAAVLLIDKLQREVSSIGPEPHQDRNPLIDYIRDGKC